MLIDDVESAIALLHQLKQLGVYISIDDFGTGYSSLGYLHRLPIDTLKVDRSFVMHMETEPKHHQIVATIAALSQQLDLEMIAEGIETPGQLACLRQLGYRLGQGHLFSRALPPEAVEALLQNSSTPARA
jgi:EAL domain-containing protein (putative c-di-GMP-specific phosphodiesterase class I)